MSPSRGNDPSRDDRELVKTLIESGSDAKRLALSGDRLWLSAPRLVIPVAMPPLASYVWREAGSLSEIGRRLRQWATAYTYNGSFFLPALSLFRDLPGCWPLLDLIWFRHHRKRWDGLQDEPAFEDELPFVVPVHNRGVDETRAIPSRVVLAAEAELIDEVDEDYPLAIRNTIPRPGTVRRPLQAVSPSVYPAYPALVYLPVVSEEVEPGDEENVVSPAPPFIGRPGILRIYQYRKGKESYHRPAKYSEERRPPMDWRPEPIYPSQPSESVWPPFIRFLRPHRLPVIKTYPVVRSESSSFIKSVTTRPGAYLISDAVVARGQTAHPLVSPYLARQAEKVLPSDGPVRTETQVAHPLFLPDITERAETVLLSEAAQPTLGSDSLSAEASSHLLSPPYRDSPAIIKTTAVRPGRPLVSPTVGGLKAPEFNLLKPEKLIPDKALELPTNVVSSKVEVEPSPPSMPLVSPLTPTVVEAPVVESAARHSARLMAAQSPAAPPAPSTERVEVSERHQPETDNRLLPFQEQLSLTGFRPEPVPLTSRADQTSLSSPPRRFEQAGRASTQERMAKEGSSHYHRNVPSPARTEEAHHPVSEPSASSGTESGAQFTASYRAGLLSMFKSQAVHEGPPAPELALAPVGRRAESTSTPSPQSEAVAEEHVPETPDLEAIANDVYRILKRRLARERERAFGVS